MFKEDKFMNKYFKKLRCLVNNIKEASKKEKIMGIVLILGILLCCLIKGDFSAIISISIAFFLLPLIDIFLEE